MSLFCGGTQTQYVHVLTNLGQVRLYSMFNRLSVNDRGTALKCKEEEMVNTDGVVGLGVRYYTCPTCSSISSLNTTCSACVHMGESQCMSQ